ncbi:hypothetical protein PIB30_071279 [Stylosanthes scabra]|uniref:TF-B3 domain-containing protein n=1 Tax=Stylosanthes scabra TaxID=79078 RepID=A0ABU6WNN3_9FABA|nr:hypothetical protein [Stylosanthes scabra]
MALTTYRDEPKRKFRSTESMWPADRDRVITHRLYHNQDERPFSGYFLARYGHEIGWQMFTIDDSDNCLEFKLVGKGKNVVLPKEAFERIRKFYNVGRGIRLQLRYVGLHIFFLTLLDRSNEEIATSPIPDVYVGRVLMLSTLSKIESTFNLKYEKLDTEFESRRYSHNALHKRSSETMLFTGQIIPSSHRKTLTTSDAYGSDLYVPADLRGELEFYGINRIWTIIGAPNPGGNVFQLMLRNSRERPGEFRFGLEWSTCCKRYKLWPGDICTFQHITAANYQMELTIERKGTV